MLDGREQDVANTIGNILIDIFPASAEKIVAKSEVLDDWAKTVIQFEDVNGTVGYFEFSKMPKRAIGDINRALVDLRGMMAEGGGDAWNRSVFTAHRDGKFSVEFSYEEEDTSDK